MLNSTYHAVLPSSFMEEGLIIKRETAVSSGNIPEKKGSKLARSRDSPGHSHERRAVSTFGIHQRKFLDQESCFGNVEIFGIA